MGEFLDRYRQAGVAISKAEGPAIAALEKLHKRGRTEANFAEVFDTVDGAVGKGDLLQALQSLRSFRRRRQVVSTVRPTEGGSTRVYRLRRGRGKKG